MAGQAELPAVAELLTRSLAEEEVADNLLTQIAREFPRQISARCTTWRNSQERDPM